MKTDPQLVSCVKYGEDNMPREKLFEAMTLSVPFETIYLDMYEVAEQYNAIIKQALDILDSGKCLSYEHTGDENVYRIQKRGKNQFRFQDAKLNVTRDLSANDVLNILYAHAPFAPLVGTENHTSLL